ncbi:hypothetical protein JD844_013820 [Phrynosoma platyrhinos]|uniref:MHC class I antigen n=1 Tax=Phrynosoma platyrhinos TaxID=52577 RepID=A0ABQ7TMB8_PHRPL|nr:hypothetical protein JD844_013820 [Phrynosoma platyrhinos]
MSQAEEKKHKEQQVIVFHAGYFQKADLIVQGTAEAEKSPSETKWITLDRDRVSTLVGDETGAWTIQTSSSHSNDTLHEASVRLDQV